ncbi:MAG: nitroreductase family protein, partial [Verrucomicrobia bacterium]|nr:nitroreductase family protein [Verrucomicrobiota bacterium]
MSPKEMVQQSLSFYQELDKRRSIRHFSDEEIPDEVIHNVLRTASTAPSGAHKQPWFFAVVRSKELKKEIRNAAEKEEYVNYHGRMGKEWIEDLEKFATNWEKPYLENAPALIVVFKKSHELTSSGKQKN